MNHRLSISQALGEPEVSDRFKTKNGYKRRIVVGWTHHNDTEEGRKRGKIWGWRSAQDTFQVYDKNYNRSEIPGDVRDCGVANFTMIRMFHPAWCPNGHIPMDMNSNDKKQCRKKYTQLYDDYKRQHNLRENDEPTDHSSAGSNDGSSDDSDDDFGDDSGDGSGDDSNDDSDDNLGNMSQHPSNHRPRAHPYHHKYRRRQNRRMPPANRTGRREGHGDAEDDPMFVTDEEGDLMSDSDDDDLKEDLDGGFARESSVDTTHGVNYRNWRASANHDCHIDCELKSVKSEIKTEDDDKTKIKTEVVEDFYPKAKRPRVEIDLTTPEPEDQQRIDAEERTDIYPEVVVLDDSDADDDRIHQMNDAPQAN